MNVKLKNLLKTLRDKIENIIDADDTERFGENSALSWDLISDLQDMQKKLDEEIAKHD